MKDKRLIRMELYRRGHLSWMLKPEQQSIYDSIAKSKNKLYVLKCSRRFGKTFTFCLRGTEVCLQGARKMVGLVAPTGKELIRSIHPSMAEISRHAHPDHRPRWSIREGAYIWQNESRLYLSGTDGRHYEDLRGMTLDEALVDEAGFCDELEYIIKSILMPQTITTGGRVIIGGTPPPTPDHDFTYICMEAEQGGYLDIRTIDDMVSTPLHVRKQYIDEAGGPDSTTAKREYYCIDQIDEERAVVPEFTREKAKAIVKEHPRPEYFDIYAALDPGGSDCCGYVLGYYDFLKAVYVIEGEVFTRHLNTDILASDIKALEKEIYPDREVYQRYSDTDIIIINDLNSLHGLLITQTEKDNKDAQINNLRVLIQREKIIIHPRCTHLVRQLYGAIWNTGRTSYARSEREGHYDLIDALIYFIRNVSVNKNPYPYLPADTDFQRQWISQELRHKHEVQQTGAVLEEIFSLDD